MRTRLFPLIVMASLTTLLGGCGQKGPLYLPQDPAAPAANGTHSHGQPAGARKDESKDQSQPPSEQHTEAEAVTK
ncbi:LPS translocon maturation chaperone LptM [Microbulbifer harenosus]|uniref:Lipoprotein n=1 Tax=Microbulbifer harenosus TaxID=2576840 RepID=A0ABY2UH02_9GAMM|nr:MULTISPECIES: lipoprotein [Microbulbifer]QIL90543.1 hypothetical protein GNX18_12815 [Microbulbifer sp. SH-1]TLM74316.1 hypothetical protein FDY93_17800 [Microbulbifer harenosus]